jgi:hypothetical protein
MLQPYMIYYRCFVGPGYWGQFKFTMAFNDEHAKQKLDRIVAGHERNGPHKFGGEFRIDRFTPPSWYSRPRSNRRRRNHWRTKQAVVGS